MNVEIKEQYKEFVRKFVESILGADSVSITLDIYQNDKTITLSGQDYNGTLRRVEIFNVNPS